MVQAQKRTVSYSPDHERTGPLPPSDSGKAAKGRLGRFSLHEELGRGGFGVVYRAYDDVLEREVALKMPLIARDDVQATERFRREAKAAARLRHPNIVVVFDSGNVEDRPFIASEFVHGETLGRIIDRGPIDYRQAAAWIRDLARALDYAHGEEVIHRDIKPENIMIGRQQRPQIMDFGLAKRLSDDGQTVDGTIFGTPAYMSPEQARGEVRDVVAESDQYSLGVVLYVLLCGRKPFEGTPLGILDEVKSDDPPPPSRHRRGIPRDLEAICSKAMEKQPRHRYPTAAALADDVQRWLDGETVRARPLNPAHRLGRWCQRNPVVAGLSVAVVVVLLSGLIGVSVAWNIALSNLDLANRKTTEAKGNLKLAQEKTKEAHDNLVLARAKGQEARKNLALANVARDKAERDSARTKVLLAYRQWESKRSELAVQLLEEVPESRRAWEWHYCYRLCQADAASIDLGERATRIATCSGGRYATAGQSVQIRLPDGTLKTVIRMPSCQSLALNPSGSRLATVRATGIGLSNPPNAKAAVFELWDTDTGKRLSRLDGIVSGSNGLSWSSDGKTVAICNDRQVLLWSADKAQVFKALGPLKNPCTDVEFGPNGQVAAAAGDEVVVWNIQQPNRPRLVLRDADTPKTFHSITFHPDGQRLAAAGTSITAWNLISRQQIFNLELASRARRGTVSYSPNGERLAWSGDTGVRVFDVQTGRQMYSSSPTAGIYIQAAEWHSDGRLIFVGGLKGDQLGIWSEHQSAMQLKAHRSHTTRVAFSSDGGILGTVSSQMPVKLAHPTASTVPMIVVHQGDFQLHLWKTDNGRSMDHVVIPQGTRAFGADVAFFSNPSRVTVMDQDGSLRIARLPDPDAEKPTPKAALDVSINGRVQWGTFAASPSGRLFAARMTAQKKKDRKLTQFGIWDTKTGKLLQTLQGGVAGFSHLAFRSDEVLVGASIKQLHVWNLKDGEHRSWDAHETFVTDVACAPQGHLAASSSHDNTAKIWSLKTGELLHVLKGHGAAGVYGVTFDKTGSRLATAGGDGTIKLWDTVTGNLVLEMFDHTEGVATVAFGPNNQRLASGDHAGIVRIWDASPFQASKNIEPAKPTEAVLNPLSDYLTSSAVHVNEFDGEKTLTDDKMWLLATSNGQLVVELRKQINGRWSWPHGTFQDGVLEVEFQMVRGGGACICLHNDELNRGLHVRVQPTSIAVGPSIFDRRKKSSPSKQSWPVELPQDEASSKHKLQILLAGSQASLFLDGEPVGQPFQLESELKTGRVCLGLFGDKATKSRVEYQRIGVYPLPVIEPLEFKE